MPLTTIFAWKPRWYPLKSTQRNAEISGEIQLAFSLTDSANPAAPTEDIVQKWQACLTSLVGTPPSEEEALDRHLGEAGIELADEDEDSSDESKSDEGSQTGKPSGKQSKKEKLKRLKHRAYEFAHGTDVVGVVYLEVSKITDLPPEHNSMYTAPWMRRLY